MCKSILDVFIHVLEVVFVFVSPGTDVNGRSEQGLRRVDAVIAQNSVVIKCLVKASSIFVDAVDGYMLKNITENSG